MNPYIQSCSEKEIQHLLSLAPVATQELETLTKDERNELVIEILLSAAEFVKGIDSEDAIDFVSKLRSNQEIDWKDYAMSLPEFVLGLIEDIKENKCTT